MFKLKPRTFLGVQQRRYSSPGLFVDLSIYSAGCTFPLHAHANAFFCLVLDGRCEEQIKGRWEPLRSGSLVYHPAGFEHANRWHEAGRCLHVEFEAGLGEGVNKARLLDAITQPNCGRACHVAKRIYDELLYIDDVSRIALEGLFLQLLAETVREAGRESRAPRWLRRVRDRLCEEVHITRPSLTQLASEAGVHPTYLAACFRKCYGLNMGEFVRASQVGRAEEMLVRNEYSLSEVAALLGFSDQSHFGRSFKRHTGHTPAEYRRLHSNGREAFPKA